MSEKPILSGRGLTKHYGARVGCLDVDIDLFSAEVLSIVGESGSGKSTLLGLLSTHLTKSAGSLSYTRADGRTLDLDAMSEIERRLLLRTEWGFVQQDARMGLRMNVSAGGNVGERLMAVGWRHYGDIRREAQDWLARVEITADWMDERPSVFSGGMRQRLQIARNMVTRPRLVFMDEPTGGLDVSVQARFLDLLRGLVTENGLSVILVTHDLAVARLLSHRIAVMREGRIVEVGLADQVLEDPQHAYTQLLVSSALQA
ncbi:MAG: phosphonate C-P lyase system protein PhnK [Beijerinckiaceae bacterium]